MVYGIGFADNELVSILTIAMLYTVMAFVILECILLKWFDADGPQHCNLLRSLYRVFVITVSPSTIHVIIVIPVTCSTESTLVSNS